MEKTKKDCGDKLCHAHGTLSLRGRSFSGKVVSSKMHKTAVVEWENTRFVKKYERYEKRRTRVKAHNPDCIGAKEGDIVKITETRPISKTKKFTIVEVFKK